MTTLFHPHNGDPIEVSADRVDAYTKQGWRKTDPAAKKKDAPAKQVEGFTTEKKEG